MSNRIALGVVNQQGRRVTHNYSEKEVQNLRAGQAPELGIFDRIRDFFSFEENTKREAILKILAELHSQSGPDDMLARFHQLRGLANPDCLDRFSIAIRRVKDDNGLESWSAVMKVGPEEFVTSPQTTASSATLLARTASLAALHKLQVFVHTYDRYLPLGYHGNWPDAARHAFRNDPQDFDKSLQEATTRLTGEGKIGSVTEAARCYFDLARPLLERHSATRVDDIAKDSGKVLDIALTYTNSFLQKLEKQIAEFHFDLHDLLSAKQVSIDSHDAERKSLKSLYESGYHFHGITMEDLKRFSLEGMTENTLANYVLMDPDADRQALSQLLGVEAPSVPYAGMLDILKHAERRIILHRAQTYKYVFNGKLAPGQLIRFSRVR